MKKLLWLMALTAFVAPAMAEEYGSYTKEELKKLCEFQKQSLQRKHNGTPACDELRRRS